MNVLCADVPVHSRVADTRDAGAAGCDSDARRISVFTPGEDDQGEWEVDAYSIEGGALRLFSQSDEEMGAYSPTGWTHMRVLER